MKVRILLFLLVLVPSFSFIQYKNVHAEEMTFLTNKIANKISTFGEAYADVEIDAFDSQRNQFASYQGTRGGDGLYDFETALGTQLDERDECVSLNGARRIGTCEDGVYSIKTIDTDAAGNSSPPGWTYIERDTVRPAAPQINEPYQCNFSNICARVTGEVGTNILLNNEFLGTLSQVNQEFVVLTNFPPATDYTFSFTLQDVAENIGFETVVEYTTPVLAVGGGGDVDGSESDPWGGQNGSDLPPVVIDVTLDKRGNAYQITNYSIPTPRLTFSTTDFDGNLKVYGYAIPKNHYLEFNVTTRYASASEAFDYCEIGTVLELSNEDNRECYEEATGKSFSAAQLERLEECALSLKNIFIPRFFHCQYGSLQGESYTEEYTLNKVVQHSMVTFTNKTKNEAWIDSLWNDAEDGRFVLETNLSDKIEVRDKLRAHSSIFGSVAGEGVIINYRGVNAEDAKNNMGLRSEYSNEVEVGEKPEVDPVQNPELYFTTPYDHFVGEKFTSAFGPRRFKWPDNPNCGGIYYCDYHTGVDITSGGQAEINTVAPGVAYEIGGYGKAIEVNHQNGFVTRYAHAAYFIGNFQREVSKGEKIIKEGKTGMATGNHLHFEVLYNGVQENPDKYFNWYLRNLPGYFEGSE